MLFRFYIKGPKVKSAVKEKLQVGQLFNSATMNGLKIDDK
jgi:hypothetical protein